MLSVASLDVGYGRSQVLWDLSLHVERGESVAVLGPNGAGKTTLLRAVSGMIAPWSGEILVGGVRTTDLPANKLVEHGLMHVPEGRGLFGSMTVEENLRLGAFARAQDRIPESLERVLAIFPELRDKIRDPARSLSGGQQQMVAVGRALMGEPKVLLLDEPTTGLAPIVVAQMVEALAEFRRTADMALLVVEQDLSVARRVADRVYVMGEGVVRMETTADALDRDAVSATYLGMQQAPSPD